MPISKKELERQKEKQRKIYLEAAALIFQERGFNDTRVKDITAKVGMLGGPSSVGNFYRYFESKEEIFEKLIGDFFERMLNKLKGLLEYDTPPPQVIKKLFRDYLDLFQENDKIGLIYIEQMGGISKGYARKKYKYIDDFTEEVSKIFIKIQNNANLKTRFKNPKLIARMWTSVILDALHFWIKSDFKADKEELINEVVNFLVRGTMS